MHPVAPTLKLFLSVDDPVHFHTEPEYRNHRPGYNHPAATVDMEAIPECLSGTLPQEQLMFWVY